MLTDRVPFLAHWLPISRARRRHLWYLGNKLCDYHASVPSEVSIGQPRVTCRRKALLTLASAHVPAASARNMQRCLISWRIMKHHRVTLGDTAAIAALSAAILALGLPIGRWMTIASMLALGTYWVGFMLEVRCWATSTWLFWIWGRCCCRVKHRPLASKLNALVIMYFWMLGCSTCRRIDIGPPQRVDFVSSAMVLRRYVGDGVRFRWRNGGAVPATGVRCSSYLWPICCIAACSDNAPHLPFKILVYIFSLFLSAFLPTLHYLNLQYY